MISLNNHLALKRVAWLASHYGYGGDLMYFEGLFAAFVRKFKNTTIYVSEEFPVGKYADLPLRRFFRFFEFRLKRNVGEVRYDAVRRFPHPKVLWGLLQLKCDIAIVVEFAPISLLVLLVMLLRRVPVLLLIENDPAYRGGGDSAVGLLVKRAAVRLADAVMTNCSAGGRYVEGRLQCRPEKLLVAPYLTSVPPQAGLDVNSPDPQRRVGCLNYLFMNSITQRKGLRQLLLAIGRCSPGMRGNMFFHVVGDGPELDSVRALSRQLGIDDKIAFYGRVSYGQTRRFFEAADVFVSPTLGDYRSLGGFEALACGLPVLISKYDGAHFEVVDAGENGFVCDPYDSADLADKLAWFQQNRSLLPGLARRSREMAAKFSYEQIAENISAAIETAMCRQGGRDRKRL